MPCYHPLKNFVLAEKTLERPGQYKCVPYSVNALRVRDDGTFQYLYDDDSINFWLGQGEIIRDFVEIPCGKCIGCRLMYSKQWMVRCLLEREYHDSAYFLTLTYTDDSVPISWYHDPKHDTGEAFQALTLRKKDFQGFMKRLRRYSGQDLRFFAAGEYGPKTFRPHYHAIVFGLYLDDLKLYACDHGINYYTSEFVSKCWSVPHKGRRRKDELPEPMGRVLIGDCTPQSCAYVSRYVTSKLMGPSSWFYHVFNIEPPFALMSRNPGLARLWYDDHPGWKDEDYIHIADVEKGLKVRPPHYFDYLLDKEDPEELERVKQARRRISQYAERLRASQSDLQYLDRLAVAERSQQARARALLRPLEKGDELNA
ncbi:replication initiator protein [Peromfec virus RodF8_33]|uniref:Replication initiator protein n=1 Tax=Peromfec virus RodF8_33 TaxID=2929370 RepID=A0A976R7Q9_9VIRU|nr:replication initiator protein [Peromfec virus RodF8_33]